MKHFKTKYKINIYKDLELEHCIETIFENTKQEAMSRLKVAIFDYQGVYDELYTYDCGEVVI